MIINSYNRNQVAFKGGFIIPDKPLRTPEQNKILEKNRTLVEEDKQKNFVRDTEYYTTGIIYYNNPEREEQTRKLLGQIKLPHIHIKAPVDWHDIESLSKGAQETMVLRKRYDAQ